MDRWARILNHPARIVPLGFALAVAVVTGLLMLPAARRGDGAAPFLTALFTATSAVCVTGLSPVDPATYWSELGHAVILGGIQVGGFGIMTGATLLAVLVSGRLGVRRRLQAQTETRTPGTGQVGEVVGRLAVFVVAAEALVAAVLTARFLALGDDRPAVALWHGVFHAVSAFNNAGFALYSDNLIGFASDPLVLVPVGLAVVLGGIGFPVVLELSARWRRPATWTTHTRITVWATLLLLALGTLGTLVLEWTNPATIGPMAVDDKLLSSWFHSAVSRTAGFNSVDVTTMRTQTWAITDALMFIGGGSAGTAGGVKVTTFFLLLFVIIAEVRGENDVTVARRRISVLVQRQATVVALLGVFVVGAGTLALLVTTPFTLDQALFECISAFATVGMSTGITADLPGPAQVVIILLMYVGRVGTVAVAAALALRTRKRLYRYPEERPIVG